MVWPTRKKKIELLRGVDTASLYDGMINVCTWEDPSFMYDPDFLFKSTYNLLHVR